MPESKIGDPGHTVPQELPSGNLASETDGNPIHESGGRGIPNLPFELGASDRRQPGALKNSFPPVSATEKLRASDASTKAAKLALNAGSSNTEA
jgi:hypothetical protein